MYSALSSSFFQVTKLADAMPRNKRCAEMSHAIVDLAKNSRDATELEKLRSHFALKEQKFLLLFSKRSSFAPLPF
jgi:hypothetical protein